MNTFVSRLRSFFIILIVSNTLWAETTPNPAESEPPKPSPTPYSLPWQLRSVMPSDGVRLDSALAFYNDRNDNSGGFAAATVASGAYKLLPNLALMGRLGMVNNNPPAGAPGATSLVNPLFGSILGAWM